MFETETDQKKCASCNFTSFYYSRRHSSCPPNQENRENSRLKNHKPGKSTVRLTSSGRLLLSDDEQLIESQEEIMTDQASPEGGKTKTFDPNSHKAFDRHLIWVQDFVQKTKTTMYIVCIIR